MYVFMQCDMYRFCCDKYKFFLTNLLTVLGRSLTNSGPKEKTYQRIDILTTYKSLTSGFWKPGNTYKPQRSGWKLNWRHILQYRSQYLYGSYFRVCGWNVQVHSSEWAILSCGVAYYVVQGGSNSWVCGWNPIVTM